MESAGQGGRAPPWPPELAALLLACQSWEPGAVRRGRRARRWHHWWRGQLGEWRVGERGTQPGPVVAAVSMVAGTAYAYNPA
jgi:hypothetical protein